MKPWILLVLLCNLGCGNLWSRVGHESKEDADETRKRVALVEEKIGLLTECSEALTAVNERQDARMTKIEESQLTEQEKKELFEGLEKYRLAQAAQVNGVKILPQPPVATYTPPPLPPSPAPVSVPLPLAAKVVVQQPVQQQTLRRCRMCPKCGRCNLW